MWSETLKKRGLQLFELLLLAATLAAAVLVGRRSEWHPVALPVLLIGLAFFSEWFSIELSEGTLSASTIAIVLAIGVLGPGPAAACGVVAVVISSAARRVPLRLWLNNLAAFAAVPFAAGLAVREIADRFGLLDGRTSHSIVLGLVVLGVFAIALVANFLFVGMRVLVEDGYPLRRQLPEFLPLLPGEIAAGALAALLAVAYKAVGLPVLIAAILVLLIFQHLVAALLRSEERAEHLQARSRQLVGLQLGVLRTLVRALEMRDETTARHAAAVAAYAAALGREVGSSEEDLDVIRAAGLLHEIGKFTWPDRVLHAKTLSPEDEGIVKTHPQVGSILVGALDGYGPVAEAILYHRERMDGRGYPAGLIGAEIPLASRILAVCSTYDTMTRESPYKHAIESREAAEELRVAARNGQLDPDLVDSFVALLAREGDEFATATDFEDELEFERRVRDMAEPADFDPSRRAPVQFGRQWFGRRREGAAR